MGCPVPCEPAGFSLGFFSGRWCLAVTLFFMQISTTKGGFYDLPSPVGFFPLNATYNATNSDPGPNQEGVVSSLPPSLAPGVRNEVGGSYSFGGSREDPSYIKVPNGGLLDTVYSISLFAWIYPESPNGEIISYWENSDSSVAVSLEENHVIFDLYSRDPSKRRKTWKAPPSLSQSTWHHVGVTYDNVTDVALIWVDGNVVMTGNVVAGGPTFLLRTRYDAWIGFLFKGKISQVGIWDVALTKDNICTLRYYWQGFVCSTADPVSLLPPTPTYSVFQTVSGDWSKVHSSLQTSLLQNMQSVSKMSSRTHSDSVSPLNTSTQSQPSALAESDFLSTTTVNVSEPRVKQTRRATPTISPSKGFNGTSSSSATLIVLLNTSTSASQSSINQSATVAPTNSPTEGNKSPTIPKLDLFAVIEGGSVLIRGLNEMVTLDASRSYDPEVGSGNYTGMTFQWFCEARVSPAKCPDLSNSSTDRVVYLDTGKLQLHETYNVTVVIRKDSRSAAAVQIIAINEGQPPQLSISCVINCGPKVSSSQRFSLSSHCVGSPCGDKFWFLFKLCQDSHCANITTTDPLTGAKLEAVSMTSLTYTPLNASNIVFKENVLNSSTRYVIVSRVGVVGGLSGVVRSMTLTLYHFLVASSPSSGVCSIAPSNGSALTTIFRILCSNWTAEDSMTYKYQYQLESGLYSLVYEGRDNSISTWLPSGNPLQGHFINLKITVSSLNGGYVDVPLKVQVFPSVNDSNSLANLVDSDSLLNRYLDEGNVEKAALLANTLLPSLSEDSSIDAAKKKMIREFVIKKFSAVKINSLATLLLVSSVIGTATDDTDVLSVQSIATLLDTFSRMVSFLKAKADQKDTSELLSIHQSAANLVHCLGNVLKMGAILATVNAANVSMTDNQDHGKKFVTFSLELVDDVSAAVLSMKLPGDEVTSIKTGDVDLVVGRYLPIDLSGMKVEAGNGTFQLPSSREVFKKTENATFVDIQMLSIPFNPYTWDYSRKRVHSDVLSLEIKDNQRKSIDISQLKSNINISLPLHEANQALELEHFAKPQSLQYHVVDVPFENTLVNIEIKPRIPKAQFFLYVKYDRRPTIEAYDWNQNISSSCVFRVKTGYNCTSKTIALVAQLSGLYYIGIRGEKTLGEKSITRKKRSCFGGGRQKRSCVEVKDPPPTPSRYKNVTVKPEYEALTDANYTLRVRLGGCAYWSAEQEKWITDGCKVASTNEKDFLKCSCNHLTAFGGGLLVAPNPIDFDKVLVEFKNLDDTGNVAVLITVIMAFVVYLVLLLLIRRADKVDVKKAGPSVEIPASSNASYRYEITIDTGVWKNSGTTANIAMIIYGTDGESEVISLGKNLGNQRLLFARGNSDTFLLHVERNLGPLLAVRIGHDNKGSSPSWFLADVIITDMQTEEQWQFPFTSWLTFDGGNNECVIEPLSNDKRFSHNLFMLFSKGFADGHLWLSVFTKQPGDSFSRVHRASCCLSVLFSAMLANAMFYKLEGKTEQVIQVGPLLFSWRQVIVGIQSALIIAPSNILIVTLFKLASRKAAKRSSFCSIATVLLCLAWFLCLATAVTSAALTVFYSLMWGPEISNQWLSSVLVSFTQDVTITEPLKVFLVAVLLASILGRKTRKKNGYQIIEESKLQEIYQGDCLHDLNGETFRQGKKQRTKFKWVLTFIREIWLYLIFVFLLMIVCYGNRSRQRYLMHQSVQKSLQAFDKVASNENFWHWMRTSYIPAMYADSWYNGMQENITVYNGGKHSILVGMPQARQLRVKETSCLRESREFVSVCYGPYSDGSQDKTPYSTPGWTAVSNLTTKIELERLCPIPWRYQTATETDSYPKWGDSINYAGGGYVAGLGYTSQAARGVVRDLELTEWLDRKTRVVMLEFAFFNPPTNLLSVSTYFYEHFPTGGATPFTRTRTISLYSEDTGIYRLYLICQLLFIFLALFYFFKEWYKLFQQKLSYFKSPWNWLELAQILVAVLAVVFYFLKVDETTTTIRELQRNVYANVGFDASILWNEGENGVLALLIFIVSLKLLRLLRFNRQVGVFSATLFLGFKRLLSFAFVLLIAFIAFLHFGILIFGKTVVRYSTLKEAVYFQLDLILGKVKARPINELAEASETFGRIFASVLLLSLTITFMNFFIAVINDSLLEAQARDRVEREDDEDRTTSTNATESTTKLDFDLISKAITRLRLSSSPGERDSDLNTEDRACSREKRQGHVIDFELVSAAIIASRKEKNFKTEQLSPMVNAPEGSAQTRLNFAKISEGIKMYRQKTNGRKVRFADKELQKHYSHLDDKQKDFFILVGKILEQPNYEDDILESFILSYFY